MPTGQSTHFGPALYFDDNNPFKPGGYIGQCTWYCWSKAHDKAIAYPDRNLDVSNLPTCNAGDWLDAAESMGYVVSRVEDGQSWAPKSDSIAVWTGHVAYVEVWDGTTVCFSEANWNDLPNSSNEIQVPSSVYSGIKQNVEEHTSTVTVTSGGTDGQFKNSSLKNLMRRGSQTLLGFIYLN